jgi:ribosome biogenesis protein Nip4
LSRRSRILPRLLVSSNSYKYLWDSHLCMGSFEEFCQRLGGQIDNVVVIGKRYFYDPEGLLTIARTHNWDPFSVGLYLGEVKRDFIPTSACIDLLGRSSERKVVVNEKAAWLYLCNRDILMFGVVIPGEFERDDLVFVVDSRENVLGYGRVFTKFNSKMKNKIYVKHILDKGEYLRRER